MNSLHQLKTIAEIITMTFQFGDQLVYGQTLQDPVVTSFVLSGVDSAPEDMIQGTATVDGAAITQQIKLGNPGCIYGIECTAEDAAGKVYVVIIKLAVLSDIGAGFGLGRGLAIVGELPDTFAYIDYYELLDIIDGYEPFGPVTVYSGNYPIGWTPTVVNHNIVTSGIANDTGTFIFTYKLVDFAGQIAYSLQEVYIPPVDLYGSIPTIGMVGVPYTGQYDTRWGMTPYVDYSITDGTLITGVDINHLTCEFTGTPTVAAVFTFDTTVTDSIDETDTEPATVTILPNGAFLASSGGPPMYTQRGSLDGLTWTDQTFNLSGPTLRFLGFNFPNTTVASGTDQFMYLSTDRGVTWTQTTNVAEINPSFGLPVSVTDFAYGNNIFVAVMDGPFTSISVDDGASWINYTTPFSNAGGDSKIAFGDGVFVLSNGSGAGIGGSVYYGTDGQNWTLGLAVDSLDVHWNGELFMVISNVSGAYTSPDGANWTFRSNPVGWVPTTITGNPGYFIAGTNNSGGPLGIYKTIDDGVNWTLEYAGGAYYASACGAGVICLGSSSGGSSLTVTVSTDDGDSWTVVNYKNIITTGLVYIGLP